MPDANYSGVYNGSSFSEDHSQEPYPAILTVSRSTAERLIGLGVDPKRIHVTPNGLSQLPPPAPPPLDASPFILMVGTLEPRK